MGLVNPLLGLFMLILNSYESYKTLKYPPPSTRTGKDGTKQPSMRAISQRKRNMKGILCIWIVWACFTAYERTAEPVVSMFIPFYDSFKTIILIFLIITRARGAEPIYLHLVRPLVKPHAITLDFAFDLFNMVGGIIAALFVAPVHLAQLWWTGRPMTWVAGQNKVDVSGALHRRQQQRPPPGTRVHSGSSATSRRNSGRPLSGTASRRQSDDGNHLRSSVPPSPPRQPGSPSRVYQQNPYATWDPASNVESPNNRPDPSDDEWHGYAPFPSAYPPTPQSVPTPLPYDAQRRGSQSTLRTLAFDPIQEDDVEFRQGSSGQHTRDTDEPEEEEEDDFDASFQTPRPTKQNQGKSPRIPPYQIYRPTSASPDPLQSSPPHGIDYIASPAISSTFGITSTLATSSEGEDDEDNGDSATAPRSTPVTRRRVKKRSKTTPLFIHSSQDEAESETASSDGDYNPYDDHEGSATMANGQATRSTRPRPNRTTSAPQPHIVPTTRSSTRLKGIAKKGGSVASSAAAKASAEARRRT